MGYCASPPCHSPIARWSAKLQWWAATTCLIGLRLRFDLQSCHQWRSYRPCDQKISIYEFLYSPRKYHLSWVSLYYVICDFGLKTLFKYVEKNAAYSCIQYLQYSRKLTNSDKKCISEPVSFCKYYKLNQISAYPAVSSEVCVLTRPPDVHAGTVGT